MTAFLVVHTDARASDDLSAERELLAAAGATFDVVLVDDADQLPARAAEADALLVRAATIDAALLDRLPRLQLVVRYGVGLDTVDVEAATAHRVVVAYFPDFCMDEVANHATMLLLACAKKLIALDRAVRDGRWRPGPLAPMGAIHGQVLGIVGLGNIGRAVAERGRALRCHVLAFDPAVGDDDFAAAGVERASSLEALLEGSDYVTLHVPLTPETRRMIGAPQLARMRPGATLINTSRGPVVDQQALVAALEEGRLAAAGLDVFEEEPLPTSSPLIAMEQVVLTPHSASYSDAAFGALRRRAAQAAIDVQDGYWPEIVANPQVEPKRALAPARTIPAAR